MSEVLPPGWALTDIGSLGRYINGRGFGKAEWKKAGLPIIRIQNLNDENASFNYSDKEHEQKYRVQDGDLLVAWAASLGVYQWERGPAWLNQHIFRVEVEERAVTKPFLYYSLKHALAALYNKAHGSGMVHITKVKFDRHPVKLPPLNEQRRIVSKIDELFSRIGEGERALEQVSKLVGRYRQSVLKAAVTGELTRDWRAARKAHGESVESGEALLARILTARRRAWEQAELAKMKAKGIKPANDKWKTRYKEPLAPIVTDLPTLPKGWVWASVDQLAAEDVGSITDGPFGSKLKTEHYTEKGPRVVRLQNIKDGWFADEKAHISEEHFATLEKHQVNEGDLLIAALGQSPPRACLVPEWLGPAIVKADCIRVRLSDSVRAACICAFLNSPTSREVAKVIIHGVGRPRLNLSEIKSLAVPLCPTAEQNEISNLIAIQFSAMDHLSAEVRDQSVLSERLRQETMRAAFSGQLVPQDPNDESALVLLGQIASEANINAAASKRGRKKKSA